LSTEKSSSAKGTSSRTLPRIPPAVFGFQSNFCRNPKCGNFGVPPGPPGKRGRPAAGAATTRKPGDYTVVAKGKALPSLECNLCGETFLMQSNLAVVEELLRISAYLEPVLPQCPNESCTLSKEPPNAAHSTRYGVNAHGTPRFRCVGCRKVFAFKYGGRPTKRQRNTHQNRDIFVHLMNAMPLRRIIKVLGISPAQLYDRIDFLYDQCQMFAGERERALLSRTDLGTRYLSVDRQKLMVNWHSKRIRKNTVLMSIASADQVSGYVFGVNVNFDPDMDPEAVEADMLRFGDDRRPRAFRRYARVWLPADWDAASHRASQRRPQRAQKLPEAIQTTYDAALDRDDIEDGDAPSQTTRAPEKGMLLHEQAVMFAHIQLVCRLLEGAKRLRFFVDQESGIRAAILTTVPQRVLNRSADAFYVRVLKDFTVDQKLAMVQKSKRRLAKLARDLLLTEQGAQLVAAREELDSMLAIGKWGDRWFKHPVSDMREPEKAACWLTDIDEPATEMLRAKRQRDYQAMLYLKASLTGIDRFFMQVRRALTLAERGITSASADRRVWFGKNAYNPEVLVKLLAIFRTYFNYCEVGDDGRTPAMRLGLARGPVAPEDIIYFVPEQPERQRASAASNQ
jgi:transposase-like protein